MKHTLALVLMVFGIVGCSKNQDTMLVCDCYTATEFIQGKLNKVECSDSLVFGLSRESLVFNERRNTINWRGSEHVGTKPKLLNGKDTGLMQESSLDFTDKNIYFYYDLVDKNRNNILSRRLTFDRVSLVAVAEHSNVTRYLKCSTAEGV